MTTYTHSGENRLRRLAETLTTPDPHIPPAARAGIDAAELKRAVALFRAVIFDGYFDPRPLDVRLTELAGILARQSARALATFRRGTTSDTVPAAGTSPSNAPTAGAVADTTPAAGTSPDNASGAAARRFGQETAERLLAELPELRRRLGTDVRAVFDGDPAAASYEEVILCYPALTAMTHYRFAHALLRLGVPILPRLITEMAHSATGIDIHPGAEIGDYFSIDHGTGVVIGETCIIGSHVRIYQGVTLGAKSFKFDAAGNILREPRHPILEDRVVVYSNSSILGRVRIGHDSVIGGNVWQTSDLPPHSRVVQGRATVSGFENGGGI
ncbi:serine acetyltransferase [uncultured Alistipes sp.]|uniref:serine O-acetyltransferase n=1 Tax=uncultured Alistipes sp. TaxID=538949 RepID=UPI002616CE7D|nr:serine acetyltransferase [uncultured Alistipes sp.]